MSNSPPDLRALLAPRSIAVVGASTSAAKVGGMPIRLLRANGYAGAIYPVHRDASEVQGLRAYPDLEAIGAPVDLGIVAVPASECEHAMRQAQRAGVRAMVMFTSGFAEATGEGVRLQSRLAAIAQEAGIALLGPNCLGVMNLHERMFATFSPVALAADLAPGRTALVSQSGAFGGYAFSLGRQHGIRFGHWITTGNEAGVQVADAIEWLASEPSCDAILAYLEGARDIKRLRTALLAARDAGKPVSMMKVGHTAAGARAARLHTGSDTGSADAYARLFADCGVRAVTGMRDLFGGAAVPPALSATQVRKPIGIFTISGGVGIIMADRAEELGFDLPALTPDAARRLKTEIPFASTMNPIDVTGQVFSRPDVLVQALADAATCGAFSGLAVFLAAAGSAPGVWPRLQECIARLHGTPSAARLAVCGILAREQREWLEANSCRVFAEPAEAIDAFA